MCFFLFILPSFDLSRWTIEAFDLQWNVMMSHLYGIIACKINCAWLLTVIEWCTIRRQRTVATNKNWQKLKQFGFIGLFAIWCIIAIYIFFRYIPMNFCQKTPPFLRLHRDCNTNYVMFKHVTHLAILCGEKINKVFCNYVKLVSKWVREIENMTENDYDDNKLMVKKNQKSELIRHTRVRARASAWDSMDF